MNQNQRGDRVSLTRSTQQTRASTSNRLGSLNTTNPNNQLYPTNIVDEEFVNILFFQDQSNSLTPINEQLPILHEAYHAARLRATEFNSMNISIPMKLHSQQASKVYSSLAILLYANICICKSSQIETYIRKKASQLPSSLVDMNEWDAILGIASDYRQAICIPESALNDIRHDLDLRVWLATQEVKATSSEMIDLRNDVAYHLIEMQEFLRNSCNRIEPAVRIYADKMNQDIRRLKTALFDTEDKLGREQKERERLLKHLDSNRVIDRYDYEREDDSVKSIKPTKSMDTQQESAAIAMELLKGLESAHIRTLQTFSESANLGRYYSLVEAFNSKADTSTKVPTVTDIYERCEVIDSAFKGYVQLLQETKDSSLKSLDEKLQNSYKEVEKEKAENYRLLQVIEELRIQNDVLIQAQRIQQVQPINASFISDDTDTLSRFADNVATDDKLSPNNKAIEPKTSELDLIRISSSSDSVEVVFSTKPETEEIRISTAEIISSISEQLPKEMTIDSSLESKTKPNDSIAPTVVDTETTKVQHDLELSQHRIQELLVTIEELIQTNQSLEGSQSKLVAKLEAKSRECQKLERSRTEEIDVSNKKLEVLATELEKEKGKVKELQLSLETLQNSHPSTSPVLIRPSQPSSKSDLKPTSPDELLRYIEESYNNEINNILKTISSMNFIASSTLKERKYYLDLLDDIESRVSMEETTHSDFSSNIQFVKSLDDLVRSILTQINTLRDNIQSSGPSGSGLGDPDSISSLESDHLDSSQSKPSQAKVVRPVLVRDTTNEQRLGPSSTVLGVEKPAIGGSSGAGSAGILGPRRTSLSVISSSLAMTEEVDKDHITDLVALKLILETIKSRINDSNKQGDLLSTLVLATLATALNMSETSKETQDHLAMIDATLNPSSSTIFPSNLSSTSTVEEISKLIQHSRDILDGLDTKNKSLASLVVAMIKTFLMNASSSTDHTPHQTMWSMASSPTAGIASPSSASMIEGNRKSIQSSKQEIIRILEHQSLHPHLYSRRKRSLLTKKEIESAKSELNLASQGVNVDNNVDGEKLSDKGNVTETVQVESNAFDTTPVVKIQSVIRGFLDRNKVHHIKTQKLVQYSGILAAYPGTKQGESGWYVADDLLFYFCVDKEDYVLLCGPITTEMYNLTMEELKIDLGTKFPTSKKFTNSIVIDRFSLHATRLQIESLMDDIQDRDIQLQLTRDALENYRQHINEEIQKLKQTHQKQLNLLKHELNEYKKIDMINQRQLSSLSQKNLLSSIEKVEEISSDEKIVNNVIKFQAAARGFLARLKVQQTRTVLSAQESGVLVALKNTAQGETGWYVGPDGHIFYFVQDNGDWILAAGPIDEQIYESTRRALKLKKFLTTTEKLPNPANSNDATIEFLTHCPFNLAIEHEEVKGDIFMSNKKEKLYVAVSVDDLILSSQIQSVSGSEYTA